MRYLYLLLMSLGLSSCISLAVTTVVDKTGLKYKLPAPTLYTEGEFDGLREFIKTTRDSANILLTHGLTDKSENHFDLLTERLATKLNLRLIKARTRIDSSDVMSNDPGNRCLGFGRWKLFQWRFHNDSLNKPVNFYFVYWAPITKPAKDFIHAFNRTEYRTQLSSQVKDSLFINIFGDLALYLNNDYKTQLRTAFLESFEHIRGPVAVLGGGFGIQLMFEAVAFELGRAVVSSPIVLQNANRGIKVDEVLEQGKEKMGKRVYQSDYNIAKVFLLTNQMPFVSLLTLRPDDNPETQEHNDQVYEAVRNFCSLKKRSIDLISFYDPNDPFGYKLPKVTDTAIHVINVRLNVAESWWIDPLKTTDFVLPQLKKQKASDLFLSVIDQKNSTQDLMLNLKGPADLSRNDYRVMGAIADGSDYKLVCRQLMHPPLRSRNVEYHPRKHAVLLNALGTAYLGFRVMKKLELKTSVLPFSLPSEFRDNKPNAIQSLPFDGVDKSIAGNDVTQVMTVHGVKNQEPDSFDDLVNSIAKSLGFYSRPTSFEVVCAAGETCPQNAPMTNSYRPGTVKRTTFTGVSGQKLIIYAVYWSSITKHAKEWLDEISIDKESSVVPRLVKQNLINDGFADIELSFGELRDKVDSTLMTAFRMMEEDHNKLSKTTTLNTYYLTGSLGSRLLLDFLNKVRHDNKTVASVQLRARSWYMLTNQLIMTALKDIRLNNTLTNDSDNAIVYEDFYKESYGDMANLLNDSSAFDVVAFNDPNDLLSFIVPDDVMGISPDAKKIYNTYLNLAQGLTVNMDALIKFACKADKKLKRIHKNEYEYQIRNYEKQMQAVCGANGVKSTDPEYTDYLDMLTIAKERFNETYAPDTAKDINPEIERLLKERVRNDGELYRKFNEKRKFYSYNIYVTEKQKINDFRNRYCKLDSIHGKKKIIKKKNFHKLYRPGLIMPFVRSLSNYMHYQDFVSDFGRAHVGAKENSKIVQMIAHGFDAVTTTNVDQKLYQQVHNVNQR
ncbi:MAG TPA: hypothetical protein VFE50_07165 [Cyclobacteriaceae bacterium]|nr:hypothetical protein [Cyclobacteriaceae bacterium]